MKLNYQNFIKIILLLYINFETINSVAVCDLATLKLEILQDIADNGMLDCQRKVGQPVSYKESEKQKNDRIAAVWDTSCSFEASQDWKGQLKEYYGIDNLVDAVGDPYEFNNEDQVDMCEIVRTMIFKTNPGINMYKLTPKVVENIDCVGFPSRGFGNVDDRTRICAATGGSFFDPRGWTIFLKPSAITMGNNKKSANQSPKFIRDTPSNTNENNSSNLRGNMGNAKKV